jgi:hypothetical protein
MNWPQPNITVDVDVTNPGQFFACCGLWGLADRLWSEAEGWFADDDKAFYLSTRGTLEDLVRSLAQAKMIHSDPEDPYSSPVVLGEPFPNLSIDWWETDRTGARDLKVWAGTMESFGIAQALQNAMRSPKFCSRRLFNVAMVITTPSDSAKKKEPYYFDARRTASAHSRDVGFSLNDLKMPSLAHPAVELLCLIGLQFARPLETGKARVYRYYTWPTPLLPSVALSASSGKLSLAGARGYQFENWFRTGQKKHKSFRMAIPIAPGD